MNDSDLITKCILQVRNQCQFFGALMLFAPIVMSKEIPTAATDGQKVFINKDFLLSLSSNQQNALLLHEVLHMALLHAVRVGSRNAEVWNIAADIVVNNLIKANTSFKLPKGAIVDETYAEQSVEFVYEKILKNKRKYELQMPDILCGGQGAKKEMDPDEINEMESYWRDKMQILRNSNLITGKEAGSLPLGMSKEIEVILEPEVDWRHALWKFVGKTPADFDDLDRRFIYKGLYLEGLLTESLEVNVCIDTSGSVSPDLLDKFLGELKGILGSYPHVKCKLFWADHNLYGPYELENIKELPEAKGFGGTSFVPFFKHLKKNQGGLLNSNENVAIYFTDGYGDFPDDSPYPTMWLVPSDCLESAAFPFGEVIRISSS